VAPDPSAQALPPGLGEACAAIARAVADSPSVGDFWRMPRPCSPRSISRRFTAFANAIDRRLQTV